MRGTCGVLRRARRAEHDVAAHADGLHHQRCRDRHGRVGTHRRPPALRGIVATVVGRRGDRHREGRRGTTPGGNRYGRLGGHRRLHPGPRTDHGREICGDLARRGQALTQPARARPGRLLDVRSGRARPANRLFAGREGLRAHVRGARIRRAHLAVERHGSRLGGGLAQITDAMAELPRDVRHVGALQERAQRPAEICRVLLALARIELHRADDHVVERDEARVVVARTRMRPAHGVVAFLGRSATKGGDAAPGLHEQHGHREDVGGRAELLALDLLGRHVAR